MELFTIGHSNRTFEEFLALLKGNDIELVADVRRLPGSTRHPQFNADALAEALAAPGIGYRRFEGLTGRRARVREVPDDVNGWWKNRSFHNYADHALGEEFADALDMLVETAVTQRVAIMCSEAVWWRCHRRLIADHLLARGHAVRHILTPGRADPAELSAGAVVDETRVTYPA